MSGTNIMRSKEEKLFVVKRNLCGEYATALAREIGCNKKTDKNNCFLMIEFALLND